MERDTEENSETDRERLTSDPARSHICAIENKIKEAGVDVESESESHVSLIISSSAPGDERCHRCR